MLVIEALFIFGELSLEMSPHGGAPPVAETCLHERIHQHRTWVCQAPDLHPRLGREVSDGAHGLDDAIHIPSDDADLRAVCTVLEKLPEPETIALLRLHQVVCPLHHGRQAELPCYLGACRRTSRPTVTRRTPNDVARRCSLTTSTGLCWRRSSGIESVSKNHGSCAASAARNTLSKALLWAE
ncbi:hypothetical protein WMF30_44940 [Sorangium sp. So ce134]